jgi:hypothetical protein
MIQVELKYESPRDLGFRTHKKTKFEFPESLDELTGNQLVKMTEILLKNYPEDIAHIKLFFAVCNCSRWFVRLRLKPDEFKLQLIDGLLKPMLLKQEITKGSLKDYLKGFTGMDDRLKNFTWKQFCLVDSFTTALRAGNNDLIDNVCALIYVPKGKAFNSQDADDYVPLWSEKPYALKLAIINQYVALKSTISKDYKQIFPQQDLSQLTPNEVLNTSSSTEQIDYHAITINLSGGPFGNREQLEKEPLHNVLKYLDINAKKPKKNAQPHQH